MLTNQQLMEFEKYGYLPALTQPTASIQMKVTIQASRTVRYDQDIELSESAYSEFKSAVDSGNEQEIQDWLTSRVDPSDVIEADEFEVLNILFL